MPRKIDYQTYLDKVRGCFLGKTVIGTLGAPYEGVKMPMALPFSEQLIDTMLPNDDLDLQVLWLDVVEKKGIHFTARMLQKAFADNCDYSPGEYAIMRKNFHKGIYPPYSGEFCNDYYIEGMGCPIRSEIWACLAPGNMPAAADFASRDGILDHKGESVYAERFFAAVEAEAFFESDLNVLFDRGLSVIPSDCKFRRLVSDVRRFCRQHSSIQDVYAEILFHYGHPDCTNLFQNMGITLAALLFGDLDMIQTGMAALNCGFDTDCTCASAGALIGIILGEKEIQRRYGWGEIRYKLGVRSHRRSDLISDFSEDVALLGARLASCIADGTKIVNAPVKTFVFDTPPTIDFTADYGDNDPTVGIGKNAAVKITIFNRGDSPAAFNGFEFVLPQGIALVSSSDSGEFAIPAGGSVLIEGAFGVAPGCSVLFEKNIISLTLKGSQNISWSFGLSGNKLWKMTGPIWKTDPVTNEKILGDQVGYFHIFPPAPTEAVSIDQIRRFHLNFAIDPETDFFTEEELFAPVSKSGTGRGGQTLIARPYKETLVQTSRDGFTLDELMGFRGPCVVYLSQILISPEDRQVCIQLGHSAPFKLFVNGELVGQRNTCDQWTSENAHFENVSLKKGENRIVLRLTRVNGDAKFSLIFSDGLTCAAHYVDFGTKAI